MSNDTLQSVSDEFAMEAELKEVLSLLVLHDTDYGKRYPLVFLALALAASIDMTCGIRIDLADPLWPVAFIELPTGQVSWHMPQHVQPWDDHSTPEKLARVRDYCGWGAR